MARILTRYQVIAAIRALAFRLHLPIELVILSERGNLIAQLGDSDVIARAKYLSAFTSRYPTEWAKRELDVAAALTRIGAHSAPPHRDWSSDLYVINDVPISLWARIDPGSETTSPLHAATLLKTFHDEAANVTLPLPWLSPVTELIPDALDALAEHDALDARILSRLWREHQRVLGELESSGVSCSTLLHGDAHAGNLVRDRERWIWMDLEDACRGPIEWDLACLWRSARLDGQEAVRDFRQLQNLPDVDIDGFTPFLEARELEATVWLLGVAYQRPERYRRTADDHLERLLVRLRT
jgi:hypothetical protein